MVVALKNDEEGFGVGGFFENGNCPLLFPIIVLDGSI